MVQTLIHARPHDQTDLAGQKEAHGHQEGHLEVALVDEAAGQAGMGVQQPLCLLVEQVDQARVR